MMKSKILLFLSGILFVALIAATTSDTWQPPKVDASLVGNGTPEDPIGVDYDKYVVEITQATTAAPELVEIHNEIGTIDTVIRTSAGLYTIWFDDNPFTDDETWVNCTIGNATAFGWKAYSITDSTLVLKFYDDTSGAADLGGNAYLEARVLKE